MGCKFGHVGRPVHRREEDTKPLCEMSKSAPHEPHGSFAGISLASVKDIQEWIPEAEPSPDIACGPANVFHWSTYTNWDFRRSTTGQRRVLWDFGYALDNELLLERIYEN
jgi:hypothetical protein